MERTPRPLPMLRYDEFTAADYEIFHAAQQGRCAICDRSLYQLNKHDPKLRRTRRRLMVDHDHTTQLVRGLLCGPCNTGLGMFRDTPALLQKASYYLITAQQQYERVRQPYCQQANMADGNGYASPVNHLPVKEAQSLEALEKFMRFHCVDNDTRSDKEHSVNSQVID